MQFQGCKPECKDLTDSNLGHGDLRDEDLIKSNLQGTNLGGENFTGGDLGGANIKALFSGWWIYLSD